MPERSYEIDESEITPPPQAPEIARRIRMPWVRIVVLLVLVGMVTAAAAGLFGETRRDVRVQGRQLVMEVDYPTRFRYKRIEPLGVYLKNISRASIDSLTIRFSTSYIDKFSNVSFTPSANEVWSVTLTDVRPGQLQRVHGHLQAEEYGNHRGTITAFSMEGDTVRASIETFVYP